MSQMAGRSAAFLEEMGVGAHWTLRRAAMSQVDEVDAAADAVPQPSMVPAPVRAPLPERAPAPLAEQPPSMPVQALAAAPQEAAARADVTDDAFAAALADAVTPALDDASPPSRIAAKADAIAALRENGDVDADADADAGGAAARHANVDGGAGAHADAASIADASVADKVATVADDADTLRAVNSPHRFASGPADPRAAFDNVAAQGGPTAAPHAANAAVDADDDSTSWFDDAPTPSRPAPVSAEAIAMMDWPAMKTAIATCTRCDLCATRRGVVPGRGATDARWIALGAGPSRLDEKENRAITGDAGQLLDNMLKAIKLNTDSDVYVTNLVKCRPSHLDGSDRAPTPDEVAACAPYLERELALTGAAMMVTFGQAAVRRLLGATAARGKVLRHGALPVVATYHPDDLLRRPEDKAKAWGDLCLARAARDGGA